MKKIYYIKGSLLLIALFLLGCGPKDGRDQEEEKNPATVEKKDSGQDPRKTILFFGTSLTAGNGLEPGQAYPALIQEKIDSLGWDYRVVNAGLSGETTASGLNRLNWVLKQDIDIIVLELGANDGLRGIPLDETRQNLQSITDTLRKNQPEADIVLAGMQMPPNMGASYTGRFKEMYPELAKQKELYFIPFLLEGVGGNPELNQPDGIHPTAEGQEILAENCWEVLKGVILERKSKP